jgi:hypothetical protein
LAVFGRSKKKAAAAAATPAPMRSNFRLTFGSSDFAGDSFAGAGCAGSVAVFKTYDESAAGGSAAAGAAGAPLGAATEVEGEKVPGLAKAELIALTEAAVGRKAVAAILGFPTAGAAN